MELNFPPKLYLISLSSEIDLMAILHPLVLDYMHLPTDMERERERARVHVCGGVRVGMGAGVCQEREREKEREREREDPQRLLVPSNDTKCIPKPRHLERFLPRLQILIFTT